LNGLYAHYNIYTDPDLGVVWAALRWVACGCARINLRDRGSRLLNSPRSHTTLKTKSAFCVIKLQGHKQL
jgi:hypothetical protein